MSKKHKKNRKQRKQENLKNNKINEESTSKEKIITEQVQVTEKNIISTEEINDKSDLEEKPKKVVENEAEQEKVDSKQQSDAKEDKEETKKYDEEKLKKDKKKELYKITTIILILIIIIAIVTGMGYFIYWKFGPKFKNASIELGTQTIEIEQFIEKESYKEKAKFITKLETIDFSKVGVHEIELEYDGVKQKAMLEIVDTIPPKVEFQDLDKYIDYKLNADDFIKTKDDLSEMTAQIKDAPEITKTGTYEINVVVKDSSNNETNKICKLNVSRVIKEYTLELGKKLKKEDVLLNKKDKEAINQKDIENINKKGIGEYTLISELDGAKEEIKIKIQDTTAPNLQLRNVSIYNDEKVSGKQDFIKSVTDASGKVITTMKTQINYNKIGNQEVVIEAEDKNGNKTKKTATLTIRKDTEPPVFHGLGNLTVSKNASVDFKKGVRATDEKDGKVSFTVDTSKVKLNTAGTYYAKYTAKDKSGNTVTRSRKITVNHNQEDTNKKFNEFYNKNLSGKSISGIISTIRSKIKYNSNWGGSDPVWYGLTTNSGNCYVHAMLVKKALDKKGISNQLIYTTDKTHYWNLVYSGGKWRHYDATPTAHTPGPDTDEQKAKSSAMHGRKWATSFPKAN